MNAISPRTLEFEPTLGFTGLGGFTGVGLLASMSGAMGQTVAPDMPSAFAMPEMNVAAEPAPRYPNPSTPQLHLPTSVQDAPQTINVIPRALMDERGATSMREALRSVTGISLAAGEGGLSGDNLTLRGFSATNDFYIDGIRDAAAYTRDPFYVEAIEVLKGPSSIMFGRGSTGGVINQTTRLPEARNFGEFTLMGTAPAGVRSTADINMAIGTVGVRLNAMGMNQTVANRDHVYNSRYGVAPSITWGLGTNTQATVYYLHQEEDNRPDFGVPYLFGRPAPVNRGNYYGLSNIDRERYTTDVVTGVLSHRFTDGVTLRNVTRYGSYWRNIDATAPRIIGTVTGLTPLDTVLVNRQPQIRTGTTTILENQTELRLIAHTGGVEHNILGGLEFGRETAQLSRYTANPRPTASLLSPDFYQSAGYQEIRTPTADAYATANRFATFLMDQMKLNQYFELLVGGRFDIFDGQQNDQVLRTHLTSNNNMWSWRAALVFKPTPTVRSYFSAGTSFNPSIETLVLTTANNNVPPEENQSFEFGGSWDITPVLALRGAIFRIDKLNARTVDPINATINVLAGKQRVDGAEISLAGTITPNWSVIAGYTYLNARILSSNNPLEVGRQLLNTPPSTAVLWTTYNLPRNFTIGGGLSYVDGRYGNNTNTVHVPSYTRYDATVSWQATPALTARVNLLNLTDKRFYEGVYQGNTTPGAGRTVMFSLAARF